MSGEWFFLGPSSTYSMTCTECGEDFGEDEVYTAPTLALEALFPEVEACKECWEQLGKDALG